MACSEGEWASSPEYSGSSPTHSAASPPVASHGFEDVNAVTFARDFEHVREIGRGRFGQATLVQHRSTAELFALKRTRYGAKGQPDAQKVLVEASALSRLDHPNVIKYFASFGEEATVCILMEYAARGDLATIMAARWDAAGAAGEVELPEAEMMGWFVQLSEGLAHVHAMRVLHRDLKLENVFVAADGEAKIGDFGIAKVLSETVEMAATCVGSPCYLSPEIVQGASYSYKSDVWSLGVMLYRIATNKFPFDAANLAQLALKITAGSFPPLSPKYSPSAHHLLALLLQIDPRLRGSMREVTSNAYVQQHLLRRRSMVAASCRAQPPLSPALRSRIPVRKGGATPGPFTSRSSAASSCGA